jgi:hypothetical protein
MPGKLVSSSVATSRRTHHLPTLRHIILKHYVRPYKNEKGKSAPATNPAGAFRERVQFGRGEEDRRARREQRLGGSVTKGDRAAALGELYHARFAPPESQVQAQGGAVRIHSQRFLFFQRGRGTGTTASVRLERSGSIGTRSSIHALREAMLDGKACGCVT